MNFIEDTEIFYVNLTSAINASISTEEIVITITDTDTQVQPGATHLVRRLRKPLRI